MVVKKMASHKNRKLYANLLLGEKLIVAIITENNRTGQEIKLNACLVFVNRICSLLTGSNHICNLTVDDGEVNTTKDDNNSNQTQGFLSGGSFVSYRHIFLLDCDQG